MKIIGRVVVAAFATILPNLAMAAPEVVPDRSFQGVGYKITSSGEVIVVAGVRDIGGKVAVCGLVWFEDATATTRAIEPRFTETITFSIAGKVLAANANQFNRFKTKDDAMAGKARCSVTSTPWKAEYGKDILKMKLRRSTTIRM